VVSEAAIIAGELGSGLLGGNRRFSAKFKAQPGKKAGLGNTGEDSSNV